MSYLSRLSKALPGTWQVFHSSRAWVEGLEASNPEALPWTAFIYPRLQLPFPFTRCELSMLSLRTWMKDFLSPAMPMDH